MIPRRIGLLRNTAEKLLRLIVTPSRAGRVIPTQ